MATILSSSAASVHSEENALAATRGTGKVAAALVALCLCSATALAQASGTCGDNLTWMLSGDGALTIVGTGEMYSYGATSYPAPWRNSRGSITTATIGNGVASLSANAFYGCSRLTSVALGSSITSIPTYAFCECSSLKNVTVPWAIPVRCKGDAFYNVPCAKVNLHVPPGTKAKYQVAAVWKEFNIIDDGPAAASTNANLRTLAVLGYSISPAFNASTTSYSLTVPYATTSITIHATAADSNAKSVTGTGEKALAVGRNACKVVVTAEYGATQKTYTITVTREAATGASATAVGQAGCTPLRLYPNPTSGELTIDNYQLTIGDRVSVYSTTGARLKQLTIYNVPCMVDISHLPAGTYIVRAGKAVGRVVKQ